MKHLTLLKYGIGVSALVATVAVTALWLAPHAPPPTASVSNERPATPQTATATAVIPLTRLTQNSAEERIYRAFDSQPLWNSKGGDARRKAVRRSLPALAAQGLDTERLENALGRIDDSAESDIEATRALIEITTSVRLGAVPFTKISEYWKIEPENYDSAPDLIEALQRNRFEALFNKLTPSHPTFAKLVSSLADYRKIAASGGWKTISATDEIKLDGKDARSALIADRLAAEGFAVGNIDALKAAVMAFQTRHGLEPDGRLGKSTLAAMNVSADARAEQIEVNLERWRHVPRDFGTDFVAVNTADASVAVFRKGIAKMEFRAVTGDRKHPTPVLASTISAVTFNPPWEIPPSIAGKEILPKLKKDPTYLAANDMEVVNGSVTDPHGEYTNWTQFDAKTLPFRLRQRPGAANALGFIKFEMQNPYNIYLHDTPSRTLFAKTERHLSHGCVRVEKPRELAAELLTWDAQAVEAAINAGQTHRVAIRPGIPVYVLYWTAVVADGQVQFRDDAYNRDAAIADALPRAKREE